MNDNIHDEITRIWHAFKVTGVIHIREARVVRDWIAGEQSRINEAVAKERERCIAAVRATADEFERQWRDGLKADTYLQGKADGADEAEDAIRTPTPTTEEGA